MSEIPSRRRQAFRSWAPFPLVVLVAFVLLVALNLNGSSIGVISSEQPAPGLLAGTPRPIRSDEFQLRTPIAISSVRQDFPATPWIGLAPTDQAATAHGGPTREWSSVFKPQDWGYLAGSSARGLAWSWWWSFAVSLWGMFALVGLMTRRPGLSGALAVIATFTPYAAWWTAPPPSLFLGYGAAAAAALFAAWMVRGRAAALVWALMAAAVGVAFALALYPPWQVSLGLAFAATGVGIAVEGRLPWRRVLWTTGVALGAAGAVVLAWAAQHWAAIDAVQQTVYPGHRVSNAGTGAWALLVDAPLNFWMVAAPGGTLGFDGQGGPYANASESASAWFVAPVAALVIVGTIELWWRRRVALRTSGTPSGARPPWTLTIVGAVMLLLLAWTLLPLPQWFGHLTFLERVQPSRTAYALGLCVVLLTAVAAVSRERPAAWRLPYVGAAAVVGGGLAVVSAYRVPWDDRIVPMGLVFLSGLVVAALLALVVADRRGTLAAWLMAGYAFCSWAVVNPLMHGVDALLQDDLTQTMASLAPEGHNPRVAVFGGLDAVAKVRAAGLQSVSGTTLYPDAELMTALAPGQEALWNNYANYLWTAAPAGTPVTISQVKGTLMNLAVDPCDPTMLAQVDPSWVVSSEKLDAGCLEQTARAKGRGDTRYWVYRVVR